MADVLGQFEISDNSGSTEAFSVTATTSVQSVPSTPGEIISGFMFSVNGNNVEISADGGVSFFKLPKDAVGAKDIKGEITQLQVRTSSGSTALELWIDFEDEL